MYFFAVSCPGLGALGLRKFCKYNSKNVPRPSSMFSLTFLQNSFYSLLYDSEHPWPVWLWITAFLFSTISHIFFTRNKSSLLLLVSGFFLVRLVTPPEEEIYREVYSETYSSASPSINHNTHSVCVIYRLAPTSKDSLAFPRNDKSYSLHLPRAKKPTSWSRRITRQTTVTYKPYSRSQESSTR